MSEILSSIKQQLKEIANSSEPSAFFKFWIDNEDDILKVLTTKTEAQQLILDIIFWLDMYPNCQAAYNYIVSHLATLTYIHITKVDYEVASKLIMMGIFATNQVTLHKLSDLFVFISQQSPTKSGYYYSVFGREFTEMRWVYLTSLLSSKYMPTSNKKQSSGIRVLDNSTTEYITVDKKKQSFGLEVLNDLIKTYNKEMIRC